ncbi:MAG: response regulator [Flavobacteriales bacterium]|nr:response regulator [Flavobacteriales bacterium]
MNAFYNQLIFIVDDDEAFLKLFSKKIENEGFRNVKTFSSADTCLLCLDQEPDIILLDYQMPGKNGIDALKDIKNSKSNARVVFLTASEDKKVADDAFKYDAFDYVVKNDTSFGRVKLLLKRINKLNATAEAQKKARRLKITLVIILLLLTGSVLLLSFLFPDFFS